MPTSVINDIKNLIGDYIANKATTEHVSLLNAKLRLLVEEFVNLEEENRNLKQQLAAYEQDRARQDKRKEFVESHGALFKFLPGHGYSETPYCVECFRTLTCLHDYSFYKCSHNACGHISNVKGGRLREILAELPPPAS